MLDKVDQKPETKEEKKTSVPSNIRKSQMLFQYPSLFYPLQDLAAPATTIQDIIQPGIIPFPR
jgi:hypothetical protein